MLFLWYDYVIVMKGAKMKETLADEIEKIIKETKLKKWEILKEKAGDEIQKMLENNISLHKQIELILKYGILEKLDYKEYVTILKNHFGYGGRTKKKKIISAINEVPQREKLIPPTKSAVSLLSEDINLGEMYLQNQAKNG